MINLTLSEWMYKFAPVTLWTGGKPTSTARKIYPYFYIDLLAGWERARQVGAREALEEAKRRYDHEYMPIFHADTETMYDYPEGLEVQDIADSGEMSCGYQRRWETGTFTFNGEQCREVIWHKHDGYGREAGRIEITIYH